MYITAKQKKHLIDLFVEWSHGLKPHEVEGAKIELFLEHKLPKDVDYDDAYEFLMGYKEDVAENFSAKLRNTLKMKIGKRRKQKPIPASNTARIEVPKEFSEDEGHKTTYRIGYNHGFRGGKKIDTSTMLIKGHEEAYKAGYATGQKDAGIKITEAASNEVFYVAFYDKTGKKNAVLKISKNPDGTWDEKLYRGQLPSELYGVSYSKDMNTKKILDHIIDNLHEYDERYRVGGAFSTPQDANDWLAEKSINSKVEEGVGGGYVIKTKLGYVVDFNKFKSAIDYSYSSAKSFKSEKDAEDFLDKYSEYGVGMQKGNAKVIPMSQAVFEGVTNSPDEVLLEGRLSKSQLIAKYGKPAVEAVKIDKVGPKDNDHAVFVHGKAVNKGLTKVEAYHVADRQMLKLAKKDNTSPYWDPMGQPSPPLGKDGVEEDVKEEVVDFNSHKETARYIKKTGYKLVNSKTREDIKIGDKCQTFRHEKVTVDGWEAPRHEGSTGRVHVKFDTGQSQGFYPSVIDAELVPVVKEDDEHSGDELIEGKKKKKKVKTFLGLGYSPVAITGSLDVAADSASVGGEGGVSEEKVPLIKVFGSKELGALHDVGIKLIEKPSYWSEITKNAIDEVKLKRIEKTIGHKLQEYEAWEIYPIEAGYDEDDVDELGSAAKDNSKKRKPQPIERGPLATVESLPKETMFIVNFADYLSDGKDNDKPYGRYLVDRTGAMRYIRFWAKINDRVGEAVETGDEVIEEAMKLIATKKSKDGKKVAKAYRDRTFDEFVVKFFTDGKHEEDADYFTDHLDDAEGTAAIWVGESISRSGSRVNERVKFVLEAGNEYTKALALLKKLYPKFESVAVQSNVFKMVEFIDSLPTSVKNNLIIDAYNKDLSPELLTIAKSAFDGKIMARNSDVDVNVEIGAFIFIVKDASTLDSGFAKRAKILTVRDLEDLLAKRKDEVVKEDYDLWKNTIILNHPGKDIKFRGKMEGEKTIVTATSNNTELGIWDDVEKSGTVLNEDEDTTGFDVRESIGPKASVTVDGWNIKDKSFVGGGSDPTQITKLVLSKPGEQKIELVQVFDWEVTSPDKETFKSDAELNSYLASKKAPSLKKIAKAIDDEYQAWSEDPMGDPRSYV